MEIHERDIYNRHSTRHFDKEYVIDRMTQERILEAGLRAPSPKNRQPWELVVLDRRDMIDQLAHLLENTLIRLKKERIVKNSDVADLEMALATAAIIRQSSLIVLVCYIRDDSNEHGERIHWPLSAQAFEVADIQSIGACVENMLLMAEHIDISSLWIADVLYAEDEITEAFELKYPMVAAVAFGKAAKYRSPRCDLKEKVRWIER